MYMPGVCMARSSRNRSRATSKNLEPARRVSFAEHRGSISRRRPHGRIRRRYRYASSARVPVDVVDHGLRPRARAAPWLLRGHAQCRWTPGRCRVQARSAFASSAEVFPEQPGEPIARVDVPRRGAFTVVVPAPAARARRRRSRRTSPPRAASGPGRDRAPPAARCDRRIATVPLLINGDGERHMTTSDGTVLGTTQIFGCAPRNRAFNVVLLAEGFTAAQQTAFNTACTAFVDRVHRARRRSTTSAPAINVFRVNVASTDSGADDPIGPGGTGATARTYFDATFGGNGIRRLLLCNTTTALQVAAAQVPEFTPVLVVVNSTIYGGSRRRPSAPTPSPTARPRSPSTRWGTPPSGSPTSTRTTPAATRPARPPPGRASRPSRTSRSTPTAPRSSGVGPSPRPRPSRR